ncbi:MAG: M14 family metallopeptidase [Myxococcota bacterium]|nr:M14 family metallopeptidase [Myxococcota bacterium]
MLSWIFLTTLSFATPFENYLQWVGQRRPIENTVKPKYLFLNDIHKKTASLIKEKPGVIQPFVLGRSVKQRTIWGFRLRAPHRDVRVKVLVFAGLHPLEWVGSEVATKLIEELVAHPIDHVELTIIPVVNVDRRILVEKELLKGEKQYRRTNAKHVDLNRDFEINRHPKSIWRHIIHDYYAVSPSPLSQPETRALDSLGDQERFDAVVSLHCFGGYIFYPWSGIYAKTDDDAEFHKLANIMVQAQRDPFPYKAVQLSHWGFPFRAPGSEIDHFYGKYGSKAFLIELTRSGLNPLSPKSFQEPFRWYNPKNPQKDIRRGVDSVLGLARYLGREKWSLDKSP